ncbi:hypothetical protein FB45DRAFT_54720 [Roridomyces roridus]|uniref:TEA domain-containing protein n=1 Tax=Roridomyces roridus TaxID=1738132 RepID=A0AAD7BP58_9AGAR|nr:hypothetical protein FB45DRAFT_54720 [Roridomyces roridus]
MYFERESTEESASASSGSSTPPTTPSADQLYAPISDGTAAWPAMQSQTTKDVLQSILKVRKSWKTLRGGETVWPLDLEAALLEGLENYQPDDSRETRMLGRFPRRNRFISDYIFDKTGKRRSAKQVGSRLQQLRESCGGKKLLHLLSPFRQPPAPSDSASSDGSTSSPVSPSSDQRFPRHTTMYIDLLPEDAEEADSLAPAQWWGTDDAFHVSERPRRLSSINPTITFLSPTAISDASVRCTVYADGRSMHVECTQLLRVLERGEAVSGYLYSTPLVPEYWKVISRSSDPTRFTIYQEILKDNSLAFHATYKFVYPASYASASASHTHTHTQAPHAPELNPGPTHAQIPHYPLIVPSWPSREDSPAQYHSPSSETSTCFPSELSNYVL